MCSQEHSSASYTQVRYGTNSPQAQVPSATAGETWGEGKNARTYHPSPPPPHAHTHIHTWLYQSIRMYVCSGRPSMDWCGKEGGRHGGSIIQYMYSTQSIARRHPHPHAYNGFAGKNLRLRDPGQIHNMLVNIAALTPAAAAFVFISGEELSEVCLAPAAGTHLLLYGMPCVCAPRCSWWLPPPQACLS